MVLVNMFLICFSMVGIFVFWYIVYEMYQDSKRAKKRARFRYFLENQIEHSESDEHAKYLKQMLEYMDKLDDIKRL
jgi:hypothetical protein